MYIWTALYIEDNLEELRDQAISIGEQLGVKCPITFLPLHVSLKISFPVDEKRVDECIDVLCDYYSKLGPFSIEIEGYEMQKGIIWLRIKENERLVEIHNHLDELMLSKFGAEPNALDHQFIYHCTLFTDTDDKLSSALEELIKYPLPSKIQAREFLIGASETGLPGTYSVFKHSHLGPSVSVKEQWDKFKNS